MNFMSTYMNDRIVNGISKYKDTGDDIDILKTFFERRGRKEVLIKYMETELQIPYMKNIVEEVHLQ